ncbi:MAG: hypothetical protein ACOCWE_02890 [Bacillota bacterium]
MPGKLIDEIIIKEKVKGVKVITLIGLAKNAGKTVAFNQLVSELAHQGYQLGLMSFGRDGEEIDAVTNKEKPRILIPPGSFFVTAEHVKADLESEFQLYKTTEITTTLGRVNIYKNTSYFTKEIELAGVNRISNLKKIKDFLAERVEYLLVDGALDRKSSSLPGLSDRTILATGAVLAPDIEGVIAKTSLAIKKLLLPRVQSEKERHIYQNLFNLNLIKNNKLPGGWLIEFENLLEEKNFKVKKIIKLSSNSSFGVSRELDEKLNNLRLDQKTKKSLILSGALTDSLGRKLSEDNRFKDFKVIIQDGTRVFLGKRYLGLLKRNQIKLEVINKIKLAAITVNPHNPEGRNLDSNKLRGELVKSFPDIPIYDVKSADYYDN